MNSRAYERLIKFLGITRVLSLQQFFHEWGMLLILAPLAIAGFGYLVFWHSPKPHEFQEYQQGEVQFFNSITAEGQGTSYHFVVELSDGKPVTVTTDSLQLALTVIKTACIEIRRYEETGNLKYALTGNHNCESSQKP